MTYGIGTPDDLISFDRQRLLPESLSRLVPGALALAASGLAGAWILYANPAGPSIDRPPAITRSALPSVLNPLRRARRIVAANAPNMEGAALFPPVPTSLRRKNAANPYGALSDPEIFSGSMPVLVGQNPPLRLNSDSDPDVSSSDLQEADAQKLENVEPPPEVPRLAESAPLPAPRPTELGPQAGRVPLRTSLRQFAQEKRESSVVPAAPADTDNRSFVEKIFSGVHLPSGPALAYANPQDGLYGTTRKSAAGLSGAYGQGTAVYDIAAHTVYLPDGTRLEAHSGLGNWLDDPHHVDEKMRGATPPNIYALELREQPFHGVQALRLIPVGSGGTVFGRTGLLAHTFMLGPNGQSNGCVSFRNYQAFLQAYKSGEIKRLAVVASLD
jgi:hypothetical protein